MMQHNTKCIQNIKYTYKGVNEVNMFIVILWLYISW